jgi:hypothetical protein
MQQHAIEYSPRQRRAGRIALLFNLAAAFSLLVCIAAVVAQQMHWGTVLIAGTQAGSPDGTIAPQSFAIYGVCVGRLAIPFARLVLPALALPALWCVVVLLRGTPAGLPRPKAAA